MNKEEIEEIKYMKTENGYKVSMPLITDDELEKIDFNFHSIVDEYIKEFINKKDKTIEQRLIYDLQQENKQLKERIEYLERSNNRREEEILSLRQELADSEVCREKAIELLGNYKHYCVPDELSNRENEDLVDKAYEILKGDSNE